MISIQTLSDVYVEVTAMGMSPSRPYEKLSATEKKLVIDLTKTYNIKSPLGGDSEERAATYLWDALEEYEEEI